VAGLCADDSIEGRYAWLIDREGLFRKIVLQALIMMFGAADRCAAGRSQAAILGKS
jgi:hypothetical protein